MPVSYKEFAAQIKAKYPEYSEVDDLELSNKIIEKYPEYKEQVSFDSGVKFDDYSKQLGAVQPKVNTSMYVTPELEAQAKGEIQKPKSPMPNFFTKDTDIVGKIAGQYDQYYETPTPQTEQRVSDNLKQQLTQEDILQREQRENKSYGGKLMDDLGEGMLSTASSLIGGTLNVVDRLKPENILTEIALRSSAGKEGYKASEELRKERGDIVKEAADWLLQGAKDVEAKSNTTFEGKSGSDLWKEGQYGSSVMEYLLGGAKSFPTSVAAFTPVGLGVIGAGSFDQKYNEVSSTTDSNMLVSAINAGGTAAFELLTEKIGAGIEKGILKKLAKETGREIAERSVKTIFYEWLKSTGMQIGTEALEEGVNAFAANVLDIATGVKKVGSVGEAVSESFKGVLDAALYGAGGGAFGGGAMGGPIAGINAAQLQSDKKQYQNNFQSADNNLTTLLSKNGFTAEDVADIKNSLLQATPENRNSVVVAISQAIDGAITKTDGKVSFSPEVSKTFTDFLLSSDRLQAVNTKYNQSMEAERAETLRLEQEQQTILNEKQQAADQLQSIASPDGMIRTVKMMDGTEMVIRGEKVVFDPETGRLDRKNSSEMLYYTDENGEVQVLNPKRIDSILSEKPIEQAAFETDQLINQEISDKELDEFLPLQPETYHDAQGTIQVQYNPQTSEIEAVLIDEQSGTPMSEPYTIDKATYAQMSGKQLPETIKTTANEPLNDGSAPVVSGDMTENAPATAEATAEAVIPTTEVPVDEQGNMLFEQAAPEITVAKLSEFFEPEEVVATIKAKVTDIQKQIEKTGKFKATGNIQKDIQAKQAQKAQLEQLNSQLQYWNSVDALITPQAQEIAPAPEVVTAPVQPETAPVVEVQPKAETKTKPAKQPKEKRKGAFIQPKIAKSLREAGEPQSLRELIMMKLMSGQKLKWDDVKSETGAILSRGLGAEYRYSAAEKKPRANNWYGYIEKADEGITPEQFAHALWETNAFESGQFEDMPLYGLDTQDILNEILDVVNSYSTTGRMADGLNEARLKLSKDEQAHIDNAINAPDEIVDSFDDYMLASFLELSNFTPEQISELNTFIDGWEENIPNYAEDNIDPTAEGGSAEDSQAVESDNGNQERPESGNSDSGVYGAAEGEEVNQLKAKILDYFGGMYEDVVKSSPYVIYNDLGLDNIEQAEQVYDEIKAEYEAEQAKVKQSEGSPVFGFENQSEQPLKNVSSGNKLPEQDGRRLWQLTSDEYVQLIIDGTPAKDKTGLKLNELVNKSREQHKHAIQHALSDGKQVPSVVLRDYPEVEMNFVLSKLDNSKKYSFQTSKSGRGIPQKIEDFKISPQFNEKLITVDLGIGEGSKTIYSTYDGWSTEQLEVKPEVKNEIPVSEDGLYQIREVKVKKNDGSIVTMFAVPTANSKGLGEKFNDLFDTLEEAIEGARQNRIEQQRDEERDAAYLEEKRLAAEAKAAKAKANEGKTSAQIMQEAREKSIIDKWGKEVEKRLADGYEFKVVDEVDKAAEKKREDHIAYLNKVAPWGNERHPQTIELNQLKADVKTGKRLTKKSYRLDKNGVFIEVPKTVLDYYTSKQTEPAKPKETVKEEKQTSPELELVTVSTELATAKAKYDKAYNKYLDLKNKLEKDPAFGMGGQTDIFGNVSGADNLFGNDGQKQAVEAVQAAKKQADDLKPAVDELQAKANKLREAVTNKILKQQEVKFEEEVPAPKEQPQGEFKYRLLYRPLSIGTYPKEGFVKHEEDGTKYGQLTYNRKLSKEEVRQFELEPVVNTDIYNGKDIVYMEEGADKYLATVSFTEYRGRKFAQIAKRDLEGITYETETLTIPEFENKIESGEYKLVGEQPQQTPEQRFDNSTDVAERHAIATKIIRDLEQTLRVGVTPVKLYDTTEKFLSKYKEIVSESDYQEAVKFAASGQQLSGVRIGEKVLINVEHNPKSTDLIGTYMHETGHKAFDIVFLGENLDNVEIDGIESFIPDVYWGEDNRTKISEAVAHQIEELLNDYTPEQIKNGDVDVSLLDERIIYPLTKTLNKLSNGKISIIGTWKVNDIASTPGSNGGIQADGNSRNDSQSEVGSNQSDNGIPETERDRKKRELAERLKNKLKPDFKRAYHGSPHSFDQFSLDHIGTGEGQQAFGYGLYFTDLQEIARQYAGIAGGVVSNKLYQLAIENGFDSFRKYETQLDDFANSVIMNKGDFDKALSNTKIDISRMPEVNKGFRMKFIDDLQLLIDKVGLENLKSIISKSRNIYNVELHEGKEPSEYDYLRWDKKVSKQIQDKIFKQAKSENILKEWNGKIVLQGVVTGQAFITDMLYVSGETLYKELTIALGSDKAASEFLLRAGIDGIQIPADYESNPNETDFNYVVFDPSAITVKERINFKKFDPELNAIAMELSEMIFEDGDVSFESYSAQMLEYVGEQIRPLLKPYYEMARVTLEAPNMTSADEVHKYDITNFNHKEYVSNRAGSGKQDSPRTNEVPGDAEIIPDNGSGSGQVGNGIKKNSVRKGGRGRSASNRSVQPSLFGESSDNEVPETNEGQPAKKPTTGDTDGRGNGIDSTEGHSDFDGRPNESDNKADVGVSETFKQRVARKLIEQQKAESIPVKSMDIDNIRETLPFLLSEQQDDVLKAETRFFGEAHQNKKGAFGKGMLFTNGTGTGKTYTGLGIAKRFAKQGKGNILIVVPSEAKVLDWAKDGKNLGLEITPLSDTKDAGTGAVVTTYANFRANEALKERDFDLVMYDESHRLMEEKTGKTSSTTNAHYAHSNVTEWQAFHRLQSVNPDYIKWQSLVDPKSKTSSREEIAAREYYKNEVEPGLEARAKQAYNNTKVVFLSATPFKAHFNLRYANGSLFDWGNETTYASASRGQSRVDAESQFFLDNFGSAYEWKFHRLQSKKNSNAEAIAMQEVQFAENLIANGAMSGRAIESDKDYSREFPRVTLDNADTFNTALNEIMSNDAPFGALRDAAMNVFRDYNYTTKLFESLKASMSIPRIQDHLDLGRKLVIFHRRKQADVLPPFQSVLDMARTEAQYMAHEAQNMEDGQKKDELNAKIDLIYNHIEGFQSRYADLLKWEQTLDYSPAIDQFKRAFGEKVVFINGDTSKKDKPGNINKFNDDNSEVKIIVVQEEAGKEGISLHDTTGKHPRVLMNLSLPISSTTTLQIEGRVYRIGQESNVPFEYPLLGIDQEISDFGNKINKKLSTTENLAMGNQARDLLRSFAEGVLFNQGTEKPNLNQGIGGKEYDKKTQSELSEFRKAVLVYQSNQKVRGSRDSREGKDYYATPEPVGQKMVEFLGLQAGESAMEPSAGHGAIAMWFPDKVSSTVIEPSYSLYTKLNARAGGGNRKMVNDIFENYNIINKYHGIAMNPPFGSGGKTAVDHVEKAFGHLHNNGRVVAIIPQGQADKRLDDFLERTPNAHLIASVKLPSSTFEQAGTSVSTRIVVIDRVDLPSKNETYRLVALENSRKGISTSDMPYEEYTKLVEEKMNEIRSKLPHTQRMDLSYAENIDELFNEIEDLSVEARQRAVEAQAQSDEAALSKGKFEQFEQKHGKTGENMFMVAPTEFHEKEVYNKLVSIAKENNGYYSSYSSKPQNVRSGFTFKTKEDADNFSIAANKELSKPEFKIIGEKGATNLDKAEEATTRLDNLRVAKEMEKGVMKINSKTGKAAFDELVIKERDALENLIANWGDTNVQLIVDPYWGDSKMKGQLGRDSWWTLNGTQRAGYTPKKSDFIEWLMSEDPFNSKVWRIDQEWSDNVNNSRKVVESIIPSKKPTPKEIRLATGWEKGVDGLWRYEQPDGNLKGVLDIDKRPTRNNNKPQGLNTNSQLYFVDILSNVLSDDNLFKAYPEFKDMPVLISNYMEGIGSYNPIDKTIQFNVALWTDSGRRYLGLSNFEEVKDKIKSVLIHEIQHAIQYNEGFAKGGSPTSFAQARYNINTLFKDIENAFDKLGYEDWLINGGNVDTTPNRNFNGMYSFAETQSKSVRDRMVSKLDEANKVINENKSIFGKVNIYDNIKDEELYRRLSGETEARNVQYRMFFSETERRENLLSETADVAPEDQIVLMDAVGVSESRPTPKPTPPTFTSRDTFLDRLQANKKYNEELKKWQADNIQEIASTVGESNEVNAKLGELNKAVDATHAKLWEGWADSQKPVKKWQNYLKENGIDFLDTDDYYLRFTMIQSRVEYRFAEFEKKNIDTFVKTFKAFDNKGISYDDLATYAKLKHADEYTEHIAARRNVKVTDDVDFAGKAAIEERIGMKADEYISEIEKLAGQDLIDTFWKQTKAINEFSLDEEVRAGIRSSESAKEIKDTFQWYVPLKNHYDLTAEDAFDYTKERGTFFVSAVKKGKGRLSESGDPFSVMASTVRSTIGASEDNVLKQTLLRLAEKDTTGSTSVSKAWFVKVDEEVDDFGNAKPIFELAPEVPYTDTDTQETYTAKVAAHNEKMKQLAEKGEAYQGKIPKLKLGVWIKPTNVREHEVHVMRNGETYLIRFNTSPRISQAVNKVNYRYYEGAIGRTFEEIGKATRFMAAAKTMFRPTFIFITNPLRDIHAGLNLAFIDEGAAFAANVASYIPRAAYTLGRRMTGNIDLNDKYDKALNTYLLNGGKTGISKILELKQVERDLKDRMNKKIHPWDSFKKVYQSISEITENQVRLAVYFAAIDKGYSALKATSMAKEATINFDRKGNGRNGLREIKSMYAFINVGFQALDNIYTKSTKDSASKKRFIGTVAMNAFAGGMLVSLISSAIAAAFGADDDEWLEDFSKLSSFERNNNFLVWTPNGVLKYPLGQEFRIYHALGMDFMMLAHGKTTATETAINMIKGLSSLVPYNPIESTAMGSWGSAMPDVVSPFTELATNRDWMGIRIYKENQSSEQAGYTKVRTNKRGEPYATETMMLFAKALDKGTGGDGAKKGWLSPNPDIIEHLLGGYLAGLYTQAMTTAEAGVKADPSEFIPSAIWKSGDDIKQRNSGLNEKYFEAKDEVKEMTRLIKVYNQQLERNENEYKANLINEESYSKVKQSLIEKIDYLQNDEYYKKNAIIKQIGQTEDELPGAAKEKQRQTETQISELKTSLVETKPVQGYLGAKTKYDALLDKVQDYRKQKLLTGKENPELEEAYGRLYGSFGKMKSIHTYVSAIEKQIKENNDNVELTPEEKKQQNAELEATATELMNQIIQQP